MKYKANLFSHCFIYKIILLFLVLTNHTISAQLPVCNNLTRTTNTYPETSNLHNDVTVELGPHHIMADWNDIDTISNLANWISCMGLTTGGQFYVTYNGQRFWLNTNRHFFVAHYPNGAPPSFLVHASRPPLFLGSWFNLNRNILALKMCTDEVVACHGYNWNSNVYHQSGLYFDTVSPSAAGCNIGYALDLTILPAGFVDTINVNTCLSYTWNRTNQSYNQTGIYSDTVFGNNNSCDSVLFLKLTIENNIQVQHQVTACDSFYWPVTNHVYYNTGTYIDTLISQNGCDSIISLDLNINHATSSTLNINACDEYFWNGNNKSYTESGEYFETIINSSGCDSNVTLNLTISFSDTVILTVNARNNYFWPENGQTYSESGVYQHLLQTQFGCDSVIILTLTIENESSKIYIPNAFSPNGSRGNQEFSIYGTNVETFQIHIFNRYGQLVFKSVDIAHSWDGTFQGQPVPLGVYVYQIQYTDTRGEWFFKEGSLTLIR